MNELIKDGTIFWNDLTNFIPKDIENTWNPKGKLEDVDGFKYEWGNYHIHGHDANIFATQGGNSESGWTISMRSGNRWFKIDGTTTRNTQLFANETHIPLIRGLDRLVKISHCQSEACPHILDSYSLRR
jgi:hypothetical protein